MHRISLGNEVLEGKNNAYLFPEDPVTLVDTGVAKPAARAELETGLAEYDLGLADVDRVLLTHYHPDHSGLASVVQEAGDAAIYVHEADAPLVRRDRDAVDALQARHRERYDRWNVPAPKRAELDASMADADTLYGPPATVTPLEDDDRIAAGAVELEVIHAPGHTAGQSMFAVEDTGDVLTGDALLPHYTPNVGGADVRVDDPLGQCLETLATIETAGFDTAWPGHREPIEDPAGRAQAIVRHHVERARLILAYLATNGPANTWAVSAHLFGDLDGIHVLHGPGEAHAHLEHMANAGVVSRTAAGYNVASARDNLCYRADATDWPLA